MSVKKLLNQLSEAKLQVNPSALLISDIPPNITKNFKQFLINEIKVNEIEQNIFQKDIDMFIVFRIRKF